MARFKPIHKGLKLLPVDLDRQANPGSFPPFHCGGFKSGDLSTSIEHTSTGWPRYARCSLFKNKPALLFIEIDHHRPPWPEFNDRVPGVVEISARLVSHP